MTAPLPALLDHKTLRAEMGIPRSTAEAIFRALPTVHFPGHRKTFVRREDVQALIASGTFADDGSGVRA